MRMGLTIGLNHNIPESQLIDPVERQHRIEIWWTIYIFDRMWGSKMGLPMQILDEDIHVDMPSPITPRWRHEEELSDTEYMTANIQLARIVGETISKLYSRRKYQETFLQRVQKLLKALKNWVDTLPESLRLNMEDLESSKKPIVSLHMAFNQCVILTTRPTLLHLLITLHKKKEKSSVTNNGTGIAPNDASTGQIEEPTVSQPVLTLSEACIHAARHSHSMILTRWINGTMPTFGYFHAHYLFSSALILAMSSFVPIGNPNDMSCFDSALDLLRSMSENGNLAAAEFYHNLEQVKMCLDTYRGIPPRPRRNDAVSSSSSTGSVAAGIGGGSGSGIGMNSGVGINNAEKLPTEFTSNAIGNPPGAFPAMPSLSLSLSEPGAGGTSILPPHHSHSNSTPTQTAAGAGAGAALTPGLSAENEHLLSGSALAPPPPSSTHTTSEPYTFPARETISGYTTQMAFLEPTMQDFLAQSDIDLGLLHPVDTFLSEAENLYTCHEL